MTARDAFAYMNEEGRLRIRGGDYAGICEVIENENARAQDMLEHLHKNRRMSMRMVTKWAERLELEDFVAYLLERGALHFGEACYFYRTKYEPDSQDLILFVAERRGKSADEAWVASLNQHLHAVRAAEAAATKEGAPSNVGAPKRDGRKQPV